MSQLFASGGQSIGVSASAPVLPVNIQDWFPLGLTGLISSLGELIISPNPASSSLNGSDRALTQIKHLASSGCL